MDLRVFLRKFWSTFPGRSRFDPEDSYWEPDVARAHDTCPDVYGMLSIKKQRLLNLAFASLPPDEAYLEVGTFQGKSLLSAMLGNAIRPVYAVDNFSEFTDRSNSLEITRKNLSNYHLDGRVTFLDDDFRNVLNASHVRHPVGLYFYDGAHDEESQYMGIQQVEPLLADHALVLVDDWRYAQDSPSFASFGTQRAVAASSNDWRLLYQLSARCNGDLGLWWNGVAVLSFRRQAVATDAERIA